MNLSKQSKELKAQMGATISTMFAVGLSPLQILILCEARHSEAGLAKGKHLFADQVRKQVDALLQSRGGGFRPTRQAYWAALNTLQSKRGFLYIAPHKKGTTKRAVALTAKGDNLFTYPKSIHPFKP